MRAKAYLRHAYSDPKPNSLGRELINLRGAEDLRVALPPIVLQNSFWGCVKNFLGSLMRSPGNYVGGHMIDPISNRESS